MFQIFQRIIRKILRKDHKWKRTFKTIRYKTSGVSYREEQRIMVCKRCGEWKYAYDDPHVYEDKMQKDYIRDCDKALANRIINDVMKS